MKLNPDCIRDILLSVEDSTDFETIFQYEKDNNDHKKLHKYSHKEILYHIRQCEMSDMIVGVRMYDDGDLVEISDLSPVGHQFLSNIRQDTIWNNTKEIAAKVGSKSLDALLQISSSVITELIKAQCGLI